MQAYLSILALNRAEPLATGLAYARECWKTAFISRPTRRRKSALGLGNGQLAAQFYKSRERRSLHSPAALAQFQDVAPPGRQPQPGDVLIAAVSVQGSHIPGARLRDRDLG